MGDERPIEPRVAKFLEQLRQHLADRRYTVCAVNSRGRYFWFGSRHNTHFGVAVRVRGPSVELVLGARDAIRQKALLAAVGRDPRLAREYCVEPKGRRALDWCRIRKTIGLSDLSRLGTAETMNKITAALDRFLRDLRPVQAQAINGSC